MSKSLLFALVLGFSGFSTFFGQVTPQTNTTQPPAVTKPPMPPPGAPDTNTAPVPPSTPVQKSTDLELDPELPVVTPSAPATNAAPVQFNVFGNPVPTLTTTNGVPVPPTSEATPPPAPPVIKEGYIVFMRDKEQFVTKYRERMKEINDSKFDNFELLSDDYDYSTRDRRNANSRFKQMKQPNYKWSQIQQLESSGKNLLDEWHVDSPLHISSPKKESILMLYPYIKGDLRPRNERVLYFRTITVLDDMNITNTSDFDAIHNADEMERYINRF